MFTRTSKNRNPKDWIRSLFAHSRSKKAERTLAEMGLGLVMALQHNAISLEQSQEDFFNLKNYRTLRDQKSNRRLLEFMEWGMELEDVAELAPQGLVESYEKMTSLAWEVIRESLPKAKSANHQVNGTKSRRRGSGGKRSR